MRLKSLPYFFATWRANPTELINRATHSNDPKFYGAQKHRVHEVLLFVTRLGLRPLTMRSLTSAYKKSGYIPIGFGYFTIALRKGEDAVKIYEFSVRCRKHEQEALVRSLNERIMLAEKYLGEFITPTRVSIENHPIVNKPCVVLHQKYISGKPLAKKPYAKYLSEVQKIKFRELLEKAEMLLNETGYLLDVNGHNIIAHNETITVIDTILMGEVDVKMRPVTLRILKREIKELDRVVKR